jgi:hypothetical protein
MDNQSFSSSSHYSDSFSYKSSFLTKPAVRLRSRQHIAHTLIPAFMQRPDKNQPTKPAEKPHKRTLTPDERTPSPIHRYTDSYDQMQNPRNSLFEPNGKRIDFYQGQLDEYTEYIEEVKKENNKEKVMIKVANFNLRVQDLLSFLGDGEISRTGIDACLTIFKRYNHDNLTKDQAKNNIAIASTAFAWKIFNENRFENLHAPSYIFRYE